MPESQLALSWDNFQQTMQTGIVQLLETEDLVDVTFCVDGKKLKAHKMILSVCSPFFKELFESNPCQHPIIFLNDVKYRVMKDLLAYMYKGEVLLTQELLPAFVRLGESLQIRGLTNEEPAASQQQRTSSASDHQLLNQRIFAESLPIHTVLSTKGATAPTIRRTMATTRQSVGGVRRSASSIADGVTGHLPLKRPKLAPHAQMTNKPRFVLDSGKLSKVEKVDEEDLLGELEGEDGHIDDLSQLDHIQHNYSYTTTNNSKQRSTSMSKQRRKSITSTSDPSTKSTRTTAAIIDPMEMELTLIHQGLESADHQQQGEDSEEDDLQHRVIIGGGGEEDIVLERDLSQDDDDGGDMGEGEEDNAEDMDGDEVEHKLMMEAAEGDAEMHTDGTGEEDLIVTTYIQGPRHYCQLLVQGYRYVKHRSNKKSTYWKCHQYDMGACKARCTISVENTVSLTGNHSHEPEDEEEDHTILVQEVRKLIKHPYAYHQKRRAIHKVKMFDYVDMDYPHQQDEQLLEDVDYDEEAAEEG